MKDDLKILKVEYLSKQLFDRSQLLNLSLGYQAKIKKSQDCVEAAIAI